LKNSTSISILTECPQTPILFNAKFRSLSLSPYLHKCTKEKIYSSKKVLCLHKVHTCSL
jgi:hypothetical protein